VTGGNIPSQFHAAVRKGILEAAKNGVLGFPLVDLRVCVLDGAAHEKDSNEMAFRLAAAEALRTALRKAGPVLLEPVMKVELTAPIEHQGDLVADLHRRRGQILGIENRPTGVVINAQVPLAGLWGYANAIRSLSRGRAAYGMTPSHFEAMPKALADALLEEAA
jgi:elongation factor G